jgi:hypothetical protein
VRRLVDVPVDDGHLQVRGVGHVPRLDPEG